MRLVFASALLLASLSVSSAAAAGNGSHFGVVEVAGQNVHWVGTGQVSWAFKVPQHTQYLAYGWWDRAGNGNEILSTLRVDGCPDWTGAGNTGASVGGIWCANPAPGWHHATWTWTAGAVDGRVCLMAEGADGGNLACANSPWAV